MINGAMNAEMFPVIELTVRSGRRRETLAAIVDSGFNGHLLLPKSTIAYLRLEPLIEFEGGTTLADGTDIAVVYYAVKVEWDGGTRKVPPIATDGGCLVGTELMRDYELSVMMQEGGAVTLTKRDSDVSANATGAAVSSHDEP